MTPAQARFWRVLWVALLLAVVGLILARQWVALLVAAVFVGWIGLTGGLWALVMRGPRRYRRNQELREGIPGLDPHVPWPPPPRRDHLASDAQDEPDRSPPWHWSEDGPRDHDDSDDR